jgi:hypothetical protein
MWKGIDKEGIDIDKNADNKANCCFIRRALATGSGFKKKSIHAFFHCIMFISVIMKTIKDLSNSQEVEKILNQ